jgi:5'-nucleotidase (lipoprotein e(P4) family)
MQKVRTIALFPLLTVAVSGQTARPQTAAPELLNSVLWAQTSVEHDAAYLQAYRLARLVLDRARSDTTWSAAIEQTAGYEHLPPAVILDVDETILDNSPEEAEKVSAGTHSDLWVEWVQQERATALPGALEFTRYAHQQGVAVFYVTNRDAASKSATRRTLAQLGFPLNAKADPIYCRGEKSEWGTDKGSRRAAIAARYRIVLLIGDDLGDFLSGVRVGPEERRRLVAAHAERWGERWIMPPNPMYGSWEAALYGNDSSLSHPDQVRRKREHIRAMEHPKRK